MMYTYMLILSNRSSQSFGSAPSAGLSTSSLSCLSWVIILVILSLDMLAIDTVRLIRFTRLNHIAHPGHAVRSMAFSLVIYSMRSGLPSELSMSDMSHPCTSEPSVPPIKYISLLYLVHPSEVFSFSECELVHPNHPMPIAITGDIDDLTS